MANLLTIAAAKAALLAAILLLVRPPARAFALRAAVAMAVGAVFGFAFFALFYVAVPAIAYEVPVTTAFVAVNAILSYGLTGATVALFPIDLPRRPPGPLDIRDRAYFISLAAASGAAFALTDNTFVRAVAIGAGLMAAAEGAALAAGRSGPVSRMLHGHFAAMAAMIGMTAGLGVFYEALNLAFPVWHWVTLADLAPLGRTALMMAIGYIVLIHPMFIAVRMSEPKGCP